MMNFILKNSYCVESKILEKLEINSGYPNVFKMLFYSKMNLKSEEYKIKMKKIFIYN